MLVGPGMFGFAPAISFAVGYLVAPVPEAAKIFVATGVFMIVAVASQLARRIAARKLRPLPRATLLLVLMGGLTLWLHDATFIKMRLTLFFGCAAALAALAVATRNPRFEAALPIDEFRLDRVGQRKMMWLLIGFASGMAALNELVWRNSSDLFWILFQIWGPVAGFLLFFAASLPTMNRHWIGQCKVRTAG